MPTKLTRVLTTEVIEANKAREAERAEFARKLEAEQARVKRAEAVKRSVKAAAKKTAKPAPKPKGAKKATRKTKRAK